MDESEIAIEILEPYGLIDSEIQRVTALIKTEYERGYRAGVMDAAKVADTHHPERGVAKRIAVYIRALAGKKEPK